MASHVVKEMAKRGMLISLSAHPRLQLNGFNVSDSRPKGAGRRSARQRVSPHRDAVLTLWRGAHAQPKRDRADARLRTRHGVKTVETHARREALSATAHRLIKILPIK